MEFHLLIVRFIVHVIYLLLICSLYRTYYKYLLIKLQAEILNRTNFPPLAFLSNIEKVSKILTCLLLPSIGYSPGLGLAFCLSQQSHKKALKFH